MEMERDVEHMPQRVECGETMSSNLLKHAMLETGLVGGGRLWLGGKYVGHALPKPTMLETILWEEDSLVWCA